MPDKSGFPRTVLLLPLSALFFLSVLNAGAVRSAAAAALALCARSVIPALFPFLAVSRLLMAQGFGEWAAPLFGGLMTPLYRLPGEAGSVLALGLAGGYPVGAAAAADLYRQGKLTRDEAQRLLSFCNNASPAYFISILGAGVFNSTRTGLWLYLIHLLSALLTGLLFRGRDLRPSAVPQAGRTTAPLHGGTAGLSAEAASLSRKIMSGQAGSVVPQAPETLPHFLPAMADAVAGAAFAVVRVCAFVVFFSTLSAPLRSLGSTGGIVSAGLLDLFSLTPMLTADRTGFVLVSALAAFGGLGVLGQTAAALDRSGLQPCVLAKAVQGVLAGGIAAALAGILL